MPNQIFWYILTSCLSMPLNTMSLRLIHIVHKTTPRMEAQMKVRLLNLWGIRVLKMVCFEWNWRQGPVACGLVVAMRLNTYVAQCHAFCATSHSQKRCKTVSLAPVEHTGQLRSTVGLCWPLFSFTVSPLFQALQSRPASLIVRPLDHTVVHLKR